MTKKTHFKLYPCDALPPQPYGVIKAHKPEKKYPMGTIVSTIRTAPYRACWHHTVYFKQKQTVIDKAITVLIGTLNNDLDDLNTRTKLTLTDIQKLTGLCLSKSYFLYENKIRLLENAGPIGVTLMIVLSESHLQHLQHRVMTDALTIQIQQ